MDKIINLYENVKEYLHKWKDKSCSWLGRLKNLQVSIILNIDPFLNANANS